MDMGVDKLQARVTSLWLTKKTPFGIAEFRQHGERTCTAAGGA